MYTHTRGCVKGMRTFSYMPFICVLRHFRVCREGRPKIKIAKKIRKNLVESKKRCNFAPWFRARIGARGSFGVLTMARTIRVLAP